MTLTRRHLLRASLLLSPAVVLPACTDRDPQPEEPEPSPVAEIGVEVPAPSGEVSAVLDAAGDELGVVLRDADGEDFWADDFSYDPAAPPALLWETQADRLWVLPAEGEPVRIAQDAQGAWRQQAGEQPPPEVSKWL
ncbi:hypothetical protein [Brachybacterium sp. UMB0905]|uniref:hypothetical protein n=1 Tax=Brachybacterium sp. UMB0905 TaxID=2069310 RepID=UPI000C7FD47E|nr:hypothetical protein [Brachybacterium sp. UMB0905]PMC74483.1 hypothetical protein CJ197_13310 [Brachybacterium sp. UMB0905]